jgi:hypothetical protein
MSVLQSIFRTRGSRRTRQVKPGMEPLDKRDVPSALLFNPPSYSWANYTSYSWANYTPPRWINRV